LSSVSIEDLSLRRSDLSFQSTQNVQEKPMVIVAAAAVVHFLLRFTGLYVGYFGLFLLLKIAEFLFQGVMENRERQL